MSSAADVLAYLRSRFPARLSGPLAVFLGAAGLATGPHPSPSAVLLTTDVTRKQFFGKWVIGEVEIYDFADLLERVRDDCDQVDSQVELSQIGELGQGIRDNGNLVAPER